MEMPEDPFSERETDAALWNAMKTTARPERMMANPQPDVEPPPAWNPNLVAGRLTPEMLDKALKDLYHSGLRLGLEGPDAAP